MIDYPLAANQKDIAGLIRLPCSWPAGSSSTRMPAGSSVTVSGLLRADFLCPSIPSRRHASAPSEKSRETDSRRLDRNACSSSSGRCCSRISAAITRCTGGWARQQKGGVVREERWCGEASETKEGKGLKEKEYFRARCIQDENKISF